MGTWLLGDSCPANHVAEYDVAAGKTTGCKTCRAQGRQASVRNSAPSRRRAMEARTAQGQLGGGDAAATERGRQLADYWSRQAPAEYAPCGADGGPCPECGGPTHWVGADTATYCPSCNAWIRDPKAAERAAEHARRGAQVAVRAAGTVARRGGAAEREARVQLGVVRRGLVGAVAEMRLKCDPDLLDNDTFKQSARIIDALLAEYITEIEADKRGETLSETKASAGKLAEIGAELAAIKAGKEKWTTPDGLTYPQIVISREQADLERQRVKRQRDWDKADAKQAAADRREAEKATRKVLSTANRGDDDRPGRSSIAAAIDPGRTAELPGWVTAAVMRNMSLIQQHGKCEMEGHPLADRPAVALFGLGLPPVDEQDVLRDGAGNPYLDQHGPQALACGRHTADAEAWVNAQPDAEGRITCRWDLK
jgi:hypothetical protein